MRDEYDFSKGVRGKYAKRYAAGTNVVFLDPDVAAAFPTADSVNEALRAVAKLIALGAGKPKKPAAKPRARPRRRLRGRLRGRL